MTRRLDQQAIEQALAAGVDRVRAVFSVDQVIGLDIALRDGRTLSVDAYNPPETDPSDKDADGTFRVYWE